VAAAAAVALGASLTGALNAEVAMVVAAIAIGTWFGAAVGLIIGRFVHAPRAARVAATSRPPARASTDRASPTPEPARIQESPRA
jgi:membrane protein DedA with SNARE-associated domain